MSRWDLSTHAFTESLHSSEYSHRQEFDDQHTRPCDEASEDIIVKSQRIHDSHLSQCYLNFLTTNLLLSLYTCWIFNGRVLTEASESQADAQLYVCGAM